MKKKVPQIKLLDKEFARYLDALDEISKMGDGLKEDVIDWNNIGRYAKKVAKLALNPQCPTCGGSLK